jgi:protein ImuB
MRRVASLYLPNLAIDRLRRSDRAKSGTRPDRSFPHDRTGSRSSPDRNEWWPAARLPENAKERTKLVALRERLEQEREEEPPPEPGMRIEDCSCPRGGGWRPGARWAQGAEGDEWLDRRIARKAAQRAELQARIETLPLHQRPPMRELGRRSEAAEAPFRGVRSSPEGGGDPHQVRWRGASVAAGFETPSTTAFGGGPPSHFGEEAALVTIRREGQRVVIAAACPAARALGLHSGMPLTQARVMVPGLDIRPADPGGDAADLDRFARHAARHWTPLVMTAPGEGLWLDIGASVHLFGGEERFARRVLRLCRRLGLTARIAVAGTAAAAYALAKCAAEPLTLCPPGREAEAIAPLPLSSLRIDPGTEDAARRLGIETIGALASLPRAPLIRRFGTEIAARLDEALGRAAEPLDPVQIAEPTSVILRLAEPIATAKAIEQVLTDLVAAFVALLEGRGMASRSIALVATRVDGTEQRLEIGTAAPTRDPVHLRRLLAMKIERIEPGFGIEAMRLIGRRVQPLAPRVIDSELSGCPPAPDLAPLIDRLATRLGERRLFRISAVESNVPERSCKPAPPLASPAPWHDCWPRPARLLSPPERIDNVVALLPDGAPRRFTWRGKSYRVRRADGPERIYGEWWRHAAETDAVRDYYQVEDEAGARFWLYRRGDGADPRSGDLSWHLQGIFG